jgi:molybdopterin-dependent oxidoreductase alpha subunit
MARDDDTPELAEVELSAVPHAAGGLAALAATTRHLVRDGAVRRGSKALLAMNQPAGFDCPGCAWPEPAAAQRSKLEFCENGAKAMAEETTTVHATPDKFAALSIDELRLLTDFELGQLGRLVEPLVLEGRHYRPISWPDAIAMLAADLQTAGPSRSALYTSGRTSNEAAFLYQLVGRLFGTNNFPDCSNMCHESSGIALTDAIGAGKGTVSLEDFEHCDLLMVIGQNPGTNHPRMLTTLREVARRGATIVAINPLREVGLARFSHPQKPLDLLGGGVALAKEFVQIQIGGDQAFFAGIAKAMFEAPETLDHAFLAEYTQGLDDYRAHVTSLAWSTLTAGCGVDEATIRHIADLYMRADATIACWAMGLTQHKHAVAMIQEIVNVMLLRGNIWRRGAGVCPVRGR